MSLTAGIVGLPNVGKSTLFNAITNANVLAANYPFATIQPNTGVVEVNDPRFDKPVSVGEIGTGDKRGEFHLDRPLENGIYMVVITDYGDGDIYTLHLTIRDNVYAYADFVSALLDSRADISFNPDVRNIINVTQGHVSAGSTIELYKLN